jgi:hypothetical protein
MHEVGKIQSHQDKQTSGENRFDNATSAERCINAIPKRKQSIQDAPKARCFLHPWDGSDKHAQKHAYGTCQKQQIANADLPTLRLFFDARHFRIVPQLNRSTIANPKRHFRKPSRDDIRLTTIGRSKRSSQAVEKGMQPIVFGARLVKRCQRLPPRRGQPHVSPGKAQRRPGETTKISLQPCKGEINEPIRKENRPRPCCALSGLCF